MKSIAITLLIFAACFLGYDYFIALPQERMVFDRPSVDSTLAESSPAVEPKIIVPMTQRFTVTTPVRVASQSTTAAQSSNSGKTPDPDSAPRTPRPDSIEVLTENWQKVSPSAFPRPVTLVRDTTFNLSFGASTLRAGAQVIALNLDKGLLLIAPSEASAARKSVPIDDTDFKSRLTVVYEKWKTEREAEARRKALEPRPQPRVDTTSPVVTTTPLDSSGKPNRSADGTYPLLLAKMRSGSPSDITPESVIRWGNAEMETIKGTPTWVIPVTYKAHTPFGAMDADTIVHVQKGKVAAWIYQGSGEEVP